MSKQISCIIVDDEPTAREILLKHLSQIERINVIGSCSNAVDAFNLINTHQIDLIFLDINMPKISGLSFAKSINKDIKIIFTTAYREYAIDGFDLQAVDYLLKPISFERLLKAVSLYTDVYQKENKPQMKTEEVSNDFIFVKADRKMVKVNFSEIVYIESIGDYLKIHTLDDTIVIRDTMGNIEAKLPEKDFIRIHRSFITSVKFIRSYTSESVEAGDKSLPIGRSYKSTALKSLESVG
ncbi:response regulator transcription factor [Mangrovivirga sp. M17]|uniref:Response regulator transcription factor n=1 Tax=Mangrovivirga halotolerans TaxID=2993936 RepID=A0ABT3RV40_9BACT|nr:response regulator transcription factor [Mangrovivirga halotolerans]MCX2745500.1 response regulator transcription factor [Mangrovivirga halotolerans]